MTSLTPGRLLVSLKGHLNSITDLQYSHAGDRLLTGSEKDGVVRVWAWEFDPAAPVYADGSKPVKHSHVLIKLTNPNSAFRAASREPRRPNRTSAPNSISCDAAIWTCDDSKIVTSQCELAKKTGSEIKPGSQYLCLWDSFTGQCLLAIGGAHAMQCSVLKPHPSDPALFCSAGTDGIAKVWDCESASTLYSYKNTLEFGFMLDDRELGKSVPFLDGCFFPDGSGLLLADEMGRVSIFDTKRSKMDRRAAPVWMKEQYFSNDKYDLLYHSNGYCIEKGSGRPPHLAPRSRCDSLDLSLPEEVCEALKKLSGPMPLDVQTARNHRLMKRSSAEILSHRRFSMPGNIVAQFDTKSTVLVHLGDEPVEGTRGAPASGQATTEGDNGTSNRPPSRLSSNYRWGDFSDNEINDAEENDSDDEDFQLDEGRSRQTSVLETLDSDDDLEFLDEPARSRRHSRRVIGVHSDESDDEFDEILGAINSPSGPFVADYDRYLFRCQGSVDREWLRRQESTSSYAGRRCYSPQLGDTVVYIPRAHFQEVGEYPGIMDPPWRDWPEGSVWPVVRCCIRHIRYRFPFKAYYGRGNAGR